MDARESESTTPPSAASARAKGRASKVERRERRRLAVSWGLWLILGGLLVNAVVGDGGYLATVRESRAEATLAAEVAAIRMENQRLIAEGQRLQSDPSAVEEVARRELGMIRPGETLVVIRDAVSAAPPRSAP
jgi:cell division protein FtsB